MPTVILYVDGFNLYYQLKKDFPAYKWLDLYALGRIYLSGYNLLEVKYYTAMVLDNDSLARQNLYLKALATTSKVSVHMGKITRERKDMRPCSGGPKICVVKNNEKQTDVSIGADMVHDAHRNVSDAIAILTNDSDQRRPLEIVRSLQKRVILLNPNAGYPPYELKNNADQVIQIGYKSLQVAQFKKTLELANGNTLTIPKQWYWPEGITSSSPY